MKWLIRTLGNITYRLGNDEAKHEQTLLESLHNRYKSLIPDIEVMTAYTETWSKCYMYKDEIIEITSVLKRILGRHPADGQQDGVDGTAPQPDTFAMISSENMPKLDELINNQEVCISASMPLVHYVVRARVCN